MSENIINDTYKIANKANKELSKLKNKPLALIEKLNNEIIVLVKRKEYAIKYRKEIDNKEKIMRIFEKTKFTKSKVENNYKLKFKEYSNKRKEMDLNMERIDNEMNEYQNQILQTIDESEKQELQKELDKIKDDQNSMMEKRKLNDKINDNENKRLEEKIQE